MINLGLSRTQRLLDYIARDILKQPHFNPSWKAIHIAGTNGKGSVAAYLAGYLRLALRKNGHDCQRIGRFTSPHFIDRWDCIQINNEPVSQRLFEDTEQRVRTLAWQVAHDLEKESVKQGEYLDAQAEERIKKDSKPTEFEILTATAFALFSLELNEVEFAVIECGLGGRLDATNALPDSAIATSVITRIGLDHLEMLGGSLESIVREKCGIFRDNVPIVYDSENDENVVGMILHEVLSKYRLEATREPTKIPNSIEYLVHGIGTTEPSEVVLQGHANDDHTNSEKATDALPSTISQMMPHQVTNLAIALTAAEIAVRTRSQEGCSIIPRSPELIEQIIRDANKSYPARLQLLHPGWLRQCPTHRFKTLNQCEILLDGAHNAQSAGVLRKYIEKKVRPVNSDSPQNAERSRPVVFVMGLSGSGDKNKVFETIFSPTLVDNFKILGTGFGPVQGMPWIRPRTQSEIEGTLSSLGLTERAKYSGTNIVQTLEEVDKLVLESHATEGGEKPLIVIAGSLYLASDFLRFLRDGREEYLNWFDHR